MIQLPLDRCHHFRRNQVASLVVCEHEHAAEKEINKISISPA